jgi:hypothetical protein
MSKKKPSPRLGDPWFLLNATSGPASVIEDVGPYSLWTTIVVSPSQPWDRPLRGFNYSVGSDVPGTNVPACRSDTNMMVAGQVVDEKQRVDSVTWTIPAIALGKYQPTGKDYAVTPRDIREFADKARLFLCVDTDGLSIPLVIDSSERGSEFLLSRPLTIGRLQPFWVELSFSGPLAIGGALQCIVTLDGERRRSVD